MSVSIGSVANCQLCNDAAVGNDREGPDASRPETPDPELLAYMDELRRKIAEDEVLGASRGATPPTLGRAIGGTAAATAVLGALAVVIVLALVLYIITTTGPR
jgi:hypothetical protein